VTLILIPLTPWLLPLIAVNTSGDTKICAGAQWPMCPSLLHQNGQRYYQAEGTNRLPLEIRFNNISTTHARKFHCSLSFLSGINSCGWHYVHKKWSTFSYSTFASVTCWELLKILLSKIRSDEPIQYCNATTLASTNDVNETVWPDLTRQDEGHNTGDYALLSLTGWNGCTELGAISLLPKL
jgi:hypothetical protein